MKRLVLYWNGIQVIRTVPMSIDERIARTKSWTEYYYGKCFTVSEEE